MFDYGVNRIMNIWKNLFSAQTKLVYFLAKPDYEDAHLLAKFSFDMNDSFEWTAFGAATRVVS